MHKIIFYQKSNGDTPVLDYLRTLQAEGSKDSRIKLNKISQYIKVLELKGTAAGKPFIDHLRGDIWELRPLRDRVLFGAEADGEFLLLHFFLKQSQKTPVREIEQAEREWKDYQERGAE